MNFWSARWHYRTAMSHDYWPWAMFPALDPKQDDEDDGPPDPPKCSDCGGKGKIELFTGVVDCETCGGSGY